MTNNIFVKIYYTIDMKYHHIQIITKTKKSHSYFSGSMFRGALGYALKKVVCINPSYQCEGCFAKDSCLYYDFYELKNVTHPYRLDIELGKDDYSFGLYLFENACEKLPYVLSAIQQMLTAQGLGKEHEKVTAFSITVNGKDVYNGTDFNLESCRFGNTEQDFLTNKMFGVTEPTNIHLKLKTPLRMKKNNRFIKDDVDLEDILRSINQRKSQLKGDASYVKLDFKPSYTLISKNLEYKTLLRKSNRQKRHMNMDGVIGEVVLAGVDVKSYELLKLGEVIGVGKQTVMGLGTIEVVGF